MSVTIFGILNIGFSLLGLVGLLFSTLVMSRLHGSGNPIMQQMQDNPTYAAWMKISIPWGGIVSAFLLAAGIGLLMLQNWARIISIGYAIYSIISCFVGGILMVNVFSSIMSRNAQGSAGMVIMFSLIGAIIGMVISLAYPILLLIFMTRPKVVAAFSLAPPPVA